MWPLWNHIFRENKKVPCPYGLSLIDQGKFCLVKLWVCVYRPLTLPVTLPHTQIQFLYLMWLFVQPSNFRWHKDVDLVTMMLLPLMRCCQSVPISASFRKWRIVRLVQMFTWMKQPPILNGQYFVNPNFELNSKLAFIKYNLSYRSFNTVLWLVA